MPRVLQQAGYKTIHVGKAHFGCMGSEGENPLNIGFDVNIAGSGIGHRQLLWRMGIRAYQGTED